MIAIVSDIHGNLEALQAVLQDMAGFDVDAIYCLGDVVGYGPDPLPCVELAMEWDLVLQGNYDKAALGDDDLSGWTAAEARRTVLRFRSQLARHDDRDAITEFLGSRPSCLAAADTFYVHGTPRNHLHEYLFPEDVYNTRKMDSIASHFESLCFCGHTHVPGLFRPNQSREFWEFLSPAECDSLYSITGDKLICNVGSVGQPRDDPRASYVLFAPGIICFRRVEYDVERTIQKLRDEDDDGFCGQRVSAGR